MYFDSFSLKFMLKILCKREEIAPEEQFLPLFTIFSYLMLDFYVKTRIRFSLRDKRLLEITEVEITRVDCIRNKVYSYGFYGCLQTYYKLDRKPVGLYSVCEMVEVYSSIKSSKIKFIYSVSSKKRLCKCVTYYHATFQGGLTVGIPGELKGMATAHQKYGKYVPFYTLFYLQIKRRFHVNSRIIFSSTKVYSRRD